MDPNELPWTWVGPRLTRVGPGLTLVGPGLTRVRPGLTRDEPGKTREKPRKNLRKTWVGPGLDLGLACVTLFKPVGARFKPVGARFKPVGPIGLKRALRFTLVRHHLLSLFKPIGAYLYYRLGRTDY